MLFLIVPTLTFLSKRRIIRCIGMICVCKTDLQGSFNLHSLRWRRKRNIIGSKDLSAWNWRVLLNWEIAKKFGICYSTVFLHIRKYLFKREMVRTTYFLMPYSKTTRSSFHYLLSCILSIKYHKNKHFKILKIAFQSVAKNGKSTNCAAKNWLSAAQKCKKQWLFLIFSSLRRVMSW